MNISTPYFNRLFTLAGLALLIVTSACKREYDSPPEKTLPVGQVLSLQELRNLFVSEPVRFEEDYSVYAVVTADETSGNLYRNIYVQDDSAAINLRLQNPGGLYEGDRIRIYLPGTVLSKYQGMLQLDSVDVDRNIVKQETNVHVEPKNVTVNEITPELQGHLIRLDSVEFTAGELGQTYSDPVGQTNQNRMLTDCEGNLVIVRTSGYANFAGTPIPYGNGSIVAVVGQFGGDMQLFIRDISEVEMEGERCTAGGPGTYLYKDFNNENLNSGGWNTFVVMSNPEPHNWEISSQGNAGNPYAVASAFNSSEFITSQSELWLISPSMDLSEATSPVLTFKNATRYDGPALKVMISSDYDGSSNPAEQGTWTEYTQDATWSPGMFTWVDSGPLPLNQFVGNNSVYVAYKYTSTSADAATWEIDDILVQEF